MARLFGGVAGTSSYDATVAKFNEVSSNDWTFFDYGSAANFQDRVDISVAGVIMDCGECHVGGGGMEYVPFSDLDQRIPLRDLTTGVQPLYGETPGAAYNATQGAVSESQFTAFNYFIDTYDVDGDSDQTELQYMDYANTGVMEMDCLLCHQPGYDYAKRNELLRDAKIDATRPVPAGLAVENSALWTAGGVNGEGIQTAPVGYGTLVNYDESQFIFDASPTTYNPGLTAGAYTLPSSWFDNNLSAKPDSFNCAYCHMNKPGVDWKKRGDNWAPLDASGNPAIDGTYEVHYNIGCMGCHERKPTEAQPQAVNWRTTYLTQGAGMLGHDPAKGTAPFSSLYNANDDAAFKSCDDCHLASVEGVRMDPGPDMIPDTADDFQVKEGEAYGAPNPNTAHAAYGLTAKIVQDAGMSGARISHIDLMTCSACHSRKVDSYDWNGMGTGNNGNPMVDATGSDPEGRLTDHENDYLIKTDMTDRSTLGWYKGKLMRVSVLNTLFWRDKNDFGGNDVNMEGKPNGMDALLMTQVNATHSIAISEEAAHATDESFTDTDGDGIDNVVVDAERINARIADLNVTLASWDSNGDTAGTVADPHVDDIGTPSLKLSMMHVAFKDQHGVSPASMAWGSGAGNDPQDPSDDNANPCLDCHKGDDPGTPEYDAALFWNGAMDTTGDNLDFELANVAPFTKVNGFTQFTDMHPNVKDRFAVRSLASRITGPINDKTSFAGNAIDLPRSATMYEETFMGKQSFGPSFTSSAAIDFTGFEKGWLLRVQIADDTGAPIMVGDPAVPLERTRMVSGNVTDVATLLSNLAAGDADFTDAFEFTISGADLTVPADSVDDGITITAKAGYSIRLTGSGNAGAFKLAGAAWKATPWTDINNNSYTGRADWVAYLNDLDGTGLPLVPANYGIGVDPNAVIDNINGGLAIETGVAVDLVADTGVNTQGQFTYEWIVNDVEATLEGSTVQKTFDRAGTWMVTLKVYDEEGKVDMAHATVVVSAPDSGISIAPVLSQPSTSTFQEFNISGYPAETDRLRIFWGDGQSEYNNLVNPVNHTYPGVGTYTITVYAQELTPELDPFGQPTGNDIVTVLESQTFDLTIIP